MMATAGADNINLLAKALHEKREAVRCVVNHALHAIMGPNGNVVCMFSRGGTVYEMEWFGMDSRFSLPRSCDPNGDWTRVLSAGLGTTFDVDLYRTGYPHTKFSTNDLRDLRRGERIFNTFRSYGLSPAWTGTREENFTITAVDDTGAKLAVAMALHDRLGSNSPFSRVSSLAQNPWLLHATFRITKSGFGRWSRCWCASWPS